MDGAPRYRSNTARRAKLWFRKGVFSAPWLQGFGACSQILVPEAAKLSFNAHSIERLLAESASVVVPAAVTAEGNLKEGSRLDVAAGRGRHDDAGKWRD
jgi:hypothetical protein